MPHVLVAGKIHAKGIDLLKAQADLTYELVEGPAEDSFASRIGDADALVIRTQPLTAEFIAAGRKLQVVSRHGVGYDAVDVAALDAREIPLVVVGDVNSAGVAEHAMTLLLSASHLAIRSDRAVREGGWDWRLKVEASEITGKNLLILGFGRIGRRLAVLAKGFGMTIRAYDPYLFSQGWPDATVRPFDDLKEALNWADAISIHMPRADRPIIGADEFAAMKASSILVNTSRGGIVEEQALFDALSTGRLFAAGIDVFDEEPPATDCPLFSLDNVVLSPHIAGLTCEGAERLAVHSVQNVIDFFAGCLDPDLIVNGVR